MGFILAVAKLKGSFWVTVRIFWESVLLLDIDEDVFYASLGGILVRLVLEFSELVYWC